MFFPLHGQADTAVDDTKCSEPPVPAVPMLLMPLSWDGSRGPGVPRTMKKRNKNHQNPRIFMEFPEIVVDFSRILGRFSG